MGTWGTGILENDFSADIYGDFFEEFDKGVHPARISKSIIANNQEAIDDQYSSNNFWLTLALAQWETGSLDPEVFTRVKNIMESKQDIEIWRECDAFDADVESRQKDLEEFIEKISIENANPKSSVRPKKPFWKFW